MERESLVARLFGFGRRKQKEAQEPPPAESGFARTDAALPVPEEDGDEPRITVPEQVIRIRTSRVKGKDEAISAIGDGFRELSSLLSSISERLARQDARAVDLSEQLKDLPEYLRALPRLQEAQNRTLGSIAERVAEGNQLATRAVDAIARLPQVQEEQTAALAYVAERISEGNQAVRGITDALARIPEELRRGAEGQEQAIRSVAEAQQKTAKVLHYNQQKALQLFHQATQKTLQNVRETVERQQEQMQEILDASVANMRRMFVLAGAFVVAGLVALGALFFLG